MSILNRLTAGHLNDDALAELWTAQAGSATEVIATPSHDHLTACAECRVRFSAFTAWMDDVRHDAIDEADEVFSPERLVAQQAQIFRRLEAAERPARVIAFPKYSATATGQPSPIYRWIGMGVAAGLIVGLGLGQLMDLRRIGMPERTEIVRTQPVPDGIVPASGSPIDPALVDAIDDAAASPRYEALRAFDTATPRAADFVTSSR